MALSVISLISLLELCLQTPPLDSV